MTPRQFAKIAISFPGAVEAEHMGHPDLRFSGKFFASLNAADGDLGMDRARIAVPSDFYVGDGWILGPKKRVTRVLDMLCCPIEGGVRRELSSFHNFETKSPNFVFGSWLHFRLY